MFCPGTGGLGVKKNCCSTMPLFAGAQSHHPVCEMLPGHVFKFCATAIESKTIKTSIVARPLAFREIGAVVQGLVAGREAGEWTTHGPWCWAKKQAARDAKAPCGRGAVHRTGSGPMGATGARCEERGVRARLVFLLVFPLFFFKNDERPFRCSPAGHSASFWEGRRVAAAWLADVPFFLGVWLRSSRVGSQLPPTSANVDCEGGYDVQTVGRVPRAWLTTFFFSSLVRLGHQARGVDSDMEEAVAGAARQHAVLL
jgi:hypothetical protein